MERQTQVTDLVNAMKQPPKDQTHSTAFVVGFVIAGLAGAGLALWKAPRPGEKTRQLIADRTESTLFNLMGMREYLTGEKVPTAIAAMRSAANGSRSARVAGSAPDEDTEPFLAPVDDGGSALPPTFRGQPLVESTSGATPGGPFSTRT